MTQIIMRELHSIELDQWITQRHYLHSTPAGAVLRLEFLQDKTRIGAMLWGRHISPKLDQEHLLQLTRMYFIDETAPYIESRSLSMARKYVRKHFPKIKGLITYASTAEHHKGTVYIADGWFKISERKSGGKGWENRAGRTNRDASKKLMFVRTP